MNDAMKGANQAAMPARIDPPRISPNTGGDR
jgi:hypothetical protein